MIDKDDAERAALLEAGQAGGRYIESLGRTELATWTPEEWASLVEVIVTDYQDALLRAREQRAALLDDDIPF